MERSEKVMAQRKFCDTLKARNTGEIPESKGDPGTGVEK
jgi:hypothetical protein